jgi:hypothetical protein
LKSLHEETIRDGRGEGGMYPNCVLMECFSPCGIFHQHFSNAIHTNTHVLCTWCYHGGIKLLFITPWCYVISCVIKKMHIKSGPTLSFRVC